MKINSLKWQLSTYYVTTSTSCLQKTEALKNLSINKAYSLYDK